MSTIIMCDRCEKIENVKVCAVTIPADGKCFDLCDDCVNEFKEVFMKKSLDTK